MKVPITKICDTYGVSRDSVVELKRRLRIRGMISEEKAIHMGKILDMILRRFPEKGVTLHTINQFEMMYNLHTLNRR